MTAVDSETASETVRTALVKADYCRVVTVGIFLTFAFWMWLDSQQSRRDSENLREIVVRALSQIKWVGNKN